MGDPKTMKLKVCLQLGALKAHIQRANLILPIGKVSKQPQPHIPQLTDGGEKTSDGQFLLRNA